MKRLIILLVAAMLVVTGSLAVGAAGRMLIISAGSENFWNWQWKAPATGSQYDLVSSAAQVAGVLSTLPTEAQAQVTAALTRINYQNNVAFLAFLGQRPTAGYQVTVGQITLTNSAMQVWIGRQSPAPDSVNATGLSYPFTVYTLPRQDLPQGWFGLDVMDQTGKGLHTELINVHNDGIWQWQWHNPKQMQPQVQLIRTAVQARRLLRTLQPENQKAVTQALQGINYRKQAALVAFLGPVPGVGHKVGIGEIRLDSAGIQVWLGVQTPTNKVSILPTLASPVDVVRIPRTSLPSGKLPIVVMDQTGRELGRK